MSRPPGNGRDALVASAGKREGRACRVRRETGRDALVASVYGTQMLRIRRFGQRLMWFRRPACRATTAQNTQNGFAATEHTERIRGMPGTFYKMRECLIGGEIPLGDEIPFERCHDTVFAGHMEISGITMPLA